MLHFYQDLSLVSESKHVIDYEVYPSHTLVFSPYFLDD